MDFKEYQRLKEVGNSSLVQPFEDNGDYPVAKFDYNIFENSKLDAQKIEAAKLDEEAKAKNLKEFGESLTIGDAFKAAVNTEWTAAALLRKAMGVDDVRALPDPNFVPTPEVLKSASHDMTPEQQDAFIKRARLAQSEEEMMQIRGKVFEFSRDEQTLSLQEHGGKIRFGVAMTDPVQIAVGAATGGAGLFGKGIKQAVGVIGVGVGTNMAAEAMLINNNPMRSTAEMDSIFYSSLGFIGGIYGLGKTAALVQNKARESIIKRMADENGTSSEYFHDVKPNDTASVVTHTVNGVEETPVKITEVNGTAVKAINLQGEQLELFTNELRPMSDEVSSQVSQLEKSGNAWKNTYSAPMQDGITAGVPVNHPMVGKVETPTVSTETPWGAKYDTPYGQINQVEGADGLKQLGFDTPPKVAPFETPAVAKLQGTDGIAKPSAADKGALSELLPTEKPVVQPEPPQVKQKRKPRSAVDINDVKPNQSDSIPVPEKSPSGQSMTDAAGRTFGIGDSVGFWKKRGNDEQFFEGKVTGFDKDGIAKVETSDGQRLMTRLIDVSEHTPLAVEQANAKVNRARVDQLVDGIYAKKTPKADSAGSSAAKTTKSEAGNQSAPVGVSVGDSVGFWKTRNGEEKFFEGTVTEVKDGIAKVETIDGQRLMTKVDDIAEHTSKAVDNAGTSNGKDSGPLLDERPHKNSLFEAKDAPALRALGEIEYGSLSLAADIMSTCELGYQSEQAQKKKPRKTK